VSQDAGAFAAARMLPATLVELLRLRALHQTGRPGYVFLVDGETTELRLTYQELDKQARAVAARLQACGAIGERVLLLYPPGLEYIAAFFGCLYAGTVAVPVHPPHPVRLSQTLRRILAIVQDARPLVTLTTAAIHSKVAALLTPAADLPAMRWLVTDDPADDLAEAWQEPAVDGTTLAVLQYTSGSTAAPKGVMLSHRNLLHNTALIHRCFEHTPNSWGINWLPPYHDMGLIGGILQPLYGSFPVTFMSPTAMLQRPYRWLRAISRYQGTTSGGPNFVYDLCVNRITPEQRATLDLRSWSLAFNGAEPIPSETLERFATTFAPCGFRREAFYPCYGLAEATLMVAGGKKACPPVIYHVQSLALAEHRVLAAPVVQADRRALVGCGQTLLDQQIVIVDPQTSTRCVSGQVGEIWVAGPSIAQGYWNRPAATADTFQAYLTDTGEGPFLRTEDLGFLQDGELFVTGRLKDVIIIAGRNHYPQDIEWTVERSHPALRSGGCAAFAVDVAGQERLVVVAEVEPRAPSGRRQPRIAPPMSRKRGAPLDVAAVIRAVRQAVAQHHGLQVYAVALLQSGSLPKTASGKIQRHICRTNFLAGTLDTVEE
jgi:acyl-CoA synthetase (AMP-forming)/AMP-acid ligase II